jgi:hypothetical protein
MAKHDRHPETQGKDPKRPDPMGDLVANAIDFLTLATEEFEGRPKHSIIAFHSAVELVLKARLMHEHWSLVVGKTRTCRASRPAISCR